MPGTSQETKVSNISTLDLQEWIHFSGQMAQRRWSQFGWRMNAHIHPRKTR
jgi:hypothetical protein